MNNSDEQKAEKKPVTPRGIWRSIGLLLSLGCWAIVAACVARLAKIYYSFAGPVVKGPGATTVIPDGGVVGIVTAKQALAENGDPTSILVE